MLTLTGTAYIIRPEIRNHRPLSRLPGWCAASHCAVQPSYSVVASVVTFRVVVE